MFKILINCEFVNKFVIDIFCHWKIFRLPRSTSNFNNSILYRSRKRTRLLHLTLLCSVSRGHLQYFLMEWNIVPKVILLRAMGPIRVSELPYWRAGWTAGGTFSVSDGTQNRVTANAIVVVAISDAGDVSRRYMAITSNNKYDSHAALCDRINRSIESFKISFIILVAWDTILQDFDKNKIPIRMSLFKDLSRIV